ncbi:extensin-like [Spinacia oleracea]|uniref:Extensin-like n=1 Tax=Spinacia oleracea TaxID=3562 RepID=A0ABM3RT15_SPIOL|nr:extensin-like [Spinacia oleracea]
MRSFQPYRHHNHHHNYHQYYSPPPYTPPRYHHPPPFRSHQPPTLPPKPQNYHRQLPNYRNVLISTSPFDHQSTSSPPGELRVYSPSSPFYSPVSPNYCGAYYYPHCTTTSSPDDHNPASYSSWSPKYSLPSPVFIPPPPPPPPASPVEDIRNT